MGTHPRIRITVGDITTELKTLQAKHIVLDYQINAIPSAELELALPGSDRQAFLNSREISLCLPGEKISIQLDGEIAFKGVITESHLIFARVPVLKLTLRHPLIALDSLRRSQVFSQQTDAEVLQSLGRAGGGITIHEKMTTKYEQKVQYQCSDWQMVRYILDQNGLWLQPRAEGAEVMKPGPAVTPEHTLSEKVLTSNTKPLIEEGEVHFSALNLPKQLKMSAWDIKSQKLLEITAKPTSLGGGLLGSAPKKTLSQEAWQFNYSTSPEQATLEDCANSLLMNLELSGVQGKFIVPGSLRYLPGQTLAVTAFGSVLNGKGMITQVRHKLDKAHWKTEIRLGRSGLLSPQVNRSMPEGLHPGVVQEFKKDERDFGRFRVSLPMLGKENNILWARFAVPYASKNSGFICYPEPGDEVVVSFFDGQPDYPVIIGAMYNPKNQAPLPVDKDNAVKGLIVSPDDQSRLEWLMNKKDKQVLLKTAENDKGILFDTSKETLTLHEGITLKADDHNQLVLNKKAELTGDSVTVKASDDNQLALSESTAELKGASVTVQGKSIDLKKG